MNDLREQLLDTSNRRNNEFSETQQNFIEMKTIKENKPDFEDDQPKNLSFQNEPNKTLLDKFKDQPPKL